MKTDGGKICQIGGMEEMMQTFEKWWEQTHGYHPSELFPEVYKSQKAIYEAGQASIQAQLDQVDEILCVNFIEVKDGDYQAALVELVRWEIEMHDDPAISEEAAKREAAEPTILLCPDEYETSSLYFDPAGDESICAGCGVGKSAHVRTPITEAIDLLAAQAKGTAHDCEDVECMDCVFGFARDDRGYHYGRSQRGKGDIVIEQPRLCAAQAAKGESDDR